MRPGRTAGVVKLVPAARAQTTVATLAGGVDHAWMRGDARLLTSRCAVVAHRSARRSAHAHPAGGRAAVRWGRACGHGGDDQRDNRPRPHRAARTLCAASAWLSGRPAARARAGHGPAQPLRGRAAPGRAWRARAGPVHRAGAHGRGVNPAPMRGAAGSRPRRGNTEARAASVLRPCAAARGPPRGTPPPAGDPALRQRRRAGAARRERRQPARQPRHARRQWPVLGAAVREPLDAVIADRATRIARLARARVDGRAQGAWAAAALRLGSMPGVGPGTTAGRRVRTVNGTRRRRPEAVTASAGRAPRPYASGTRVRGGRHSGGGGNRRRRTAVELVSRRALRSNPGVKRFSDRLRAAGNPHKVAPGAAARTLLQLAWAVVTQERPVDPG